MHRRGCHHRNSAVTAGCSDGHSGDSWSTHGCFAKMRGGNQRANRLRCESGTAVSFSFPPFSYGSLSRLQRQGRSANTHRNRQSLYRSSRSRHIVICTWLASARLYGLFGPYYGGGPTAAGTSDSSLRHADRRSRHRRHIGASGCKESGTQHNGWKVPAARLEVDGCVCEC